MDIKKHGTDRTGQTTSWHSLKFDLIGSCKTGEFIEPTPKSRRKRFFQLAIGLVLGGLIVAVMQWGVDPWVHRYIEHIRRLSARDPVVGALRRAQFNSLFWLVPVLASAGMSLWGVILSLRVLRAGRWPLPGTKVARRTEVLGGWCIDLRFGLLPLVMVGVMLFVCVSYIKLTTMFWNRYLDARIQTYMKPHVPARPHALEFNARKSRT